MTQKQRIKQLETEIADLKLKVAILEARPMIITLVQPPSLAPQSVPCGPSAPYIGDYPPNMGTATCGIKTDLR